jgi:predicted DNA-binding WGR domain protein
MVTCFICQRGWEWTFRECKSAGGVAYHVCQQCHNMGYNGPPPKGAKPVGHVPPPPPAKTQQLPPESYTTERYECTENGHNKFWEVWYPAPWSSATSWGVRFGAIGTQGQTKSWTENVTNAARVVAQTAAQSKLRKGYVKVSGTLHVGQDTAAPSEAWQQQQKQQSKPIIKVQLSPAPLPQKQRYGIGSLTPAQIQAAASLLKAGMTHDVIAKTLHIYAEQVAAVAASGQQAAEPQGDNVGKRKFDWSE